MNTRSRTGYYSFGIAVLAVVALLFGIVGHLDGSSSHGSHSHGSHSHEQTARRAPADRIIAQFPKKF